MSILMLLMFLLPRESLVIPITKVFGLGQIYSISFILMLAGASWALINVNSLPMVVDMTDNSRLGTLTPGCTISFPPWLPSPGRTSMARSSPWQITTTAWLCW